MAHLDDLSQEILNLIVKLLKSDHTALFNLCVTFRRFTHEARLLLYSEIRVADPAYMAARHPPNMFHIDVPGSAKLFTTFTIHNPALAKYVQSFIYRVFTRPEPHYVDLVQHSLRLMTGLKTLSFNLHDVDMLPDTFFEGCTFQLTTFLCGSVSSYKNRLRDFLIAQPQIQSLYYIDHKAFPPDCLPNLQTLRTCDWDVAFEVLIGRPTICHLELSGSVPKKSSIVPGLLGNITVLACKELDDFDAFEAAVPQLKHLRVLALVGLLYLKNIHQRPEIIARLKSLSTYIWSTTGFMSPIFWRAWGPETHSSAAHSWFRNIPDLKKVYIQIGDDADDERINASWGGRGGEYIQIGDDTERGLRYAYWGEDGGEPTILLPPEVEEGHGFKDFNLFW